MRGKPIRPAEPSTQKLPGIIDTLGEAFALLVQRPYLIILPIVLDLYLWLGVALSSRPLADVAVRWMRGIPNADPQAIDTARTALDGFDLFSLLGVNLPSLLGELGRSAVAGVGPPHVIASLPWWAIPPLAVAMIALGIVVGITYLTMIACLVRGDSVLTGQFLRQAGLNTLRMFGFILVAILGVLLLVMPVLVFGSLLTFVGVNVVAVLALLVWLAIMWALFLLFFAQDAIVLTEAGPLRAVYLSYNVVRRNLWSAAGFVVVYLLIMNGVPEALRLFTRSAWGVPFAIVGNAFVATGLFTAAMLFYRDRVLSLANTTGPPAGGQGS